MLVLGRKIDQSIVIDDKIKITVVKITKSSVKIAIEAPPEISINRSEIEKQRKSQD